MTLPTIVLLSRQSTLYATQIQHPEPIQEDQRPPNETSAKACSMSLEVCLDQAWQSNTCIKGDVLGRCDSREAGAHDASNGGVPLAVQEGGHSPHGPAPQPDGAAAEAPPQVRHGHAQVVHLVRAQRHILSPRLAGALQKMLPLVCMEKTEATDSPAACIRHMKGKPSSLRL